MKIAAIGGGVIGGGWAARFLLNGHDVAVYDPAPGAEAATWAMVDNAARAYDRLLLAPLPEPGTLTFAPTVAEAVAGAGYVQESVPERLELKHTVLAEVLAATDAPVGSSTSGFRPSELQAGLGAGRERVFVAHPFNPVYLLPLVEIVASPATDPVCVATVAALLASVGMHPLRVRKEIDAHIADRLLEAVWREGLWLVHDGVATTADIDDAIRFGFGLRWAQMGLFETYRIAGGEAGMRHFLAQFGPALKWPWTKLTDVPELTDALVETIAAQSDAQSGMHTIGDLERKRDDNVVGFLQVLKANAWGAGLTLAAYEERLWKAAGTTPATLVLGEPLRLVSGRVRPDWADYNGHMTESRYLEVFGNATDAFLAFVGMDAAYRAAGRSVYTVETHLRHLREVVAGEPYAVATTLLGHDGKRVRLVHEMTSGDTLLATAEHMLLSVDTAAGRAAPMGEALAARIAAVAAAHAGVPRPDWAGQAIRAVG